jgi:hypothetical protein
MAHDVFAPDLVRRYTCIGHLCTEPLSVSRPVHLDTRARWIRVATRGVHVLRDVRIPTRVYTSRVPGTRQLHANASRGSCLRVAYHTYSCMVRGDSQNPGFRTLQAYRPLEVIRLWPRIVSERKGFRPDEV